MPERHAYKTNYTIRMTRTMRDHMEQHPEINWSACVRGLISQRLAELGMAELIRQGRKGTNR
ncbi:MAG: hypothetical protein GY758_00945 [Fuerstiella sp.]|nr:hypothetical protein [Fuerstiella sp.]